MNEKKRTELVEKRSAHRKVFENEDHSFTAEIYLDAVHYQDDDGSWKEMDDGLAEEDKTELSETETKAEKSGIKEKSFFNKKGKFQFHMKEHARERGMFTLKNGDAVLRWGLKGAKTVNAVKVNNKKLQYQEILPGVEMRCCTNGERVKEDLILTSAMSANKFTYIYELNGLTPVQYRNSVGFKDAAGKECFRVSAPYMKDAAGNTSEAITVMLDTQGKQAEMSLPEKECRITFSADKEWLTAPERVYPVTIDPVTTTSKARADIMDAHVDSLYEEDNFQQSIILKTRGGDYIQRSFIKFDLPEMKTGDMVVGARLVLASFAQDNKERSIAVHKVLHSWSSSTINWNNKPLYEETVQDICRYTADKAKYITFDITRLVKDWYQNGKNYGLMFKDEYEIFGRYTEYQASDNDDDFENQRPRIEISYMNYSGIEDYWSYHTQDVGRAGTVYVNDYNGNLILVHDTLSMGGSGMPISLAHVYNSNDKNEDIGYGYGVRLNYHQTLESVTIAGTKYYKHVDDNGTVHYFYKDSEGVWKDEAITDRILTEEADGTFTIKDKEDNKLIFSSGGYLKKVVDNNGQTLSITYSSKRISKIKDAAERSVTFTYAECSDGKSRLSKIKAPDESEKTFAYSDTGMLTAITDVDKKVMTYTYNKDRDLVKVDNIDRYNVCYTYYTTALPYRVKTITEYADKTKGKALTLVYGHNSTKFKDNKGNTEIYRFNNLGNLIHIHDGFGHAASAKYDRTGNQVNCLKNATKLQDNIVQLFKNPAMLNGSSGWNIARYPDKEAGECTLDTSSSYCMIGSDSLKCHCNDLEGYAGWYQEVTIRRGVMYTASMYVCADITEAGDGGALLRVRYTDSNEKDRYINSECLKRTTAGFVRLSITFTIPEDAKSDKIKFYMMVRHAVGTAYGDLAQLEVGDTANRCNLIDNGALHLGKDTDYAKTGDAEDVLTTVGTSERVSFHHNLVVVKSSTVLYGDATADDTKKVATLTKDTHVSGFAAVVEKLSTGTTKTWYHVVTESGKYGYVVSSDVAAYVSSGDSLTAGIVAVTADLMASAASEGERVKWSVPQHCPLVVISSKTDTDGKLWYRVGLTIDNIRYIGYLPEKAVTRMYMERYYRTFAETVSLYSKPSASGSIIKTYAANTQLRIAGIVTDASGTDWYAVRAGSVYGYLKGSLVSETEKLLLSRRNREKVEEGVPGLDKHIFKFYGRSDKDKKRTKKLAISGKKGDTFLVNAWGKGTPLPETDNDKKRRFGVEVVFVASDGTEDVHYTNFSPDILDWQFLSDVYVAKKAYTSVKVSYTYCHQANTAYFDGLALFKEEFGQTYTYDDDNNVISVVDSQSNKQKFEYNSTNDMTGVTDAKGNSFKYKYDDKHRVTKGTSAQGVVYMFEYDKESGNVKKSGAVNPSDTAKGTWQTRTFTTDKNHVASVTDAEENTVEYSWNLKKDILNSMKDANGNVLSYAYDDLKRLTEVSQSATVNGAKKTVSNTYKYKDERLSSITHNGFDYGFVYDGFGNTSAVSIAGTKVIGHKYASRNGNLTKTTYGNGAYIRYVYDAQDRVKETYYSNSSSGAEALLDSYVYDKQGNLVQVTNHPSGKTYHLSYDFLDRLMRTRDEEGNLCEYKYDANNKMTRMRHTHTTASGNTYYTYDKDGREATVRAASTATRTTSYDSLGRVKNQQWADADGTVFDSVSYSYPSSKDNCSTRPNVMKLGSRKLTYTYDGNGNITAITDSAGDMTASYVYDERNQLIRENSKDQGKTFVYAYDEGGNLTSIKEYAYTTGTLGSVVKTIKGTYSSTWKDQLTKWNGEAITYDAIGNMLTHGDTSYTWTQGRKLASVVKNGLTSKYLYDHTGMRVSKTVDGVETRYRYAGRLLLSEKATGGKTLFFRYDSASNLISMTYNSNLYFYVKNLQGDIIGLVNTVGEMVVEYMYDAWGKVLEISGSLASTVGEKNPFRYRGYYYDSETEMYYLQSRYYDPEVKRFINADETDSLEKQEDLYDKNLYAYCDNNPVMRVDSGGAVWHLIIGAVVGIATQFIADVGIGLATGNSFGEVICSLSPVDYASAAIGGAIAASGIGFTNAVVANAALGGGTYLANCSYKGEEATTGDLVASAAIGGIAGAIGGSGANGKNMRGVYSRSKQVIATTKSARKTAMYAAKIEAVKKNIVKSGVKTFVAGIYSNTHNSFRKNITRSLV